MGFPQFSKDWAVTVDVRETISVTVTVTAWFFRALSQVELEQLARDQHTQTAREVSVCLTAA